MLVVAGVVASALVVVSGTAAGSRLTGEAACIAEPCLDPNIPELGPGANLGPAFTCGYLTAPENRANPNGRTIRIAVARVPAATATARPAPEVLCRLRGLGCRRRGRQRARASA